jgi:hypothetical protein
MTERNGNGAVNLIRDEAGRFVPGSRGPGRPRGARNKFSELFAVDFMGDWAKHGLATLERVRLEKPEVYLKAAVLFLRPYYRESRDDHADPLDHLQTVEEVQEYIVEHLPALLPPGYEVSPKRHRGKPKA